MIRQKAEIRFTLKFYADRQGRYTNKLFSFGLGWKAAAGEILFKFAPYNKFRAVWMLDNSTGEVYRLTFDDVTYLIERYKKEQSYKATNELIHKSLKGITHGNYRGSGYGGASGSW